MKGLIRTIAEHAPTILFVIGLLVLCLSVSQWSGPMAGVIAGGALMVIGALPAYLAMFRGIHRARKDN